LTSVHPPFDVRIFHKECGTLAKAGFDVTLIAPHTSEETVDGVRVLAVKRAGNRRQRMTETAHATYRRAVRLQADLYHLHDPELLPWGLLLQRQTGAPVIYDAHEYVDMGMVDKEWIPRRIARVLARVIGAAEKAIARRLAGIIVVNPHMQGLFRDVNPRVAVVANFPFRVWTEQSVGTTSEPDSAIYVGGIGNVRGFELMLEATTLARRRKPSVVCRVLGQLDPAGLSRSAAALSREELRARGIEFMRTVDHVDAARCIARHSVGWVPWRWCSVNLYGTPTKLLEYMACGRPALVSNLPFMSKIVTDNECGVVARWDSPTAHADALLHLFEHPEQARWLGENGRRAVRERLNWESQVEALLALYASCLSLRGMT
jgi:glycosyltransferase involved in cell wall biosynthesis